MSRGIGAKQRDLLQWIEARTQELAGGGVYEVPNFCVGSPRWDTGHTLQVRYVPDPCGRVSWEGGGEIAPGRHVPAHTLHCRPAVPRHCLAQAYCGADATTSQVESARRALRGLEDRGLLEVGEVRLESLEFSSQAMEKVWDSCWVWACWPA